MNGPHGAGGATRGGARPKSSGRSTATSPTTTTTHSSAQASPTGRGGGGGGGGRSKRPQPIKTEEPPLSSPESVLDEEDKDESRIGVKRACNECRQQKLRCDVVQEPFAACSRCKRCGLDCRIDANFKRVGKRKRNAEMENEIVWLRKQLAQQSTTSPTAPAGPAPMTTTTTATSDKDARPSTPGGAFTPGRRQIAASPLDQYMGSHDAVNSLLDLKTGGDFTKSPNPRAKPPQRLEDVLLTPDQITELFNIFFTRYHPLQPLLDPDRPPEYYLEASNLLFWTVISVAARHYAPQPGMLRSLASSLTRLLWATIADVPQNYHVVKALCILCVWPLPVSSTSADPTVMICGLMMQIAKQIGLHRPSHAQDFSRFRVEVREEELRDRVKTWAACNVVAQRVGTGYGQPPITHYDWTLGTSMMRESAFRLPPEMDARLRIEQFIHKVTDQVYSNSGDPVGLVSEDSKAQTITTLGKELADLERQLGKHLTRKRLHPYEATLTTEAINTLYLRAAGLHLRLSVFFDPPTTETYGDDLGELWHTARKFLETAFEFKAGPHSSIKYASNYLLQMILAGGFALLKLLNSFFANMVDLEYGKQLFTRTIKVIRAISVMQNDLPMRLAEVLAQLWQAGGAGGLPSSPIWDGSMNDTLQLKVRCRMSMSLVYDSVWRWREEFQVKGRDNLESAVRNPTNPESIAGSTIASSDAASVAPEPVSLGPVGPGIKMETMLAPPSSASMLGRSPSPAGTGLGDFGFPGEWYNDVFDPLTWALDGFLGDQPFGSGMGLDSGSGML